MNKFTIAFIFLLASSIASPLMAGDLDEPYNPSRKEWLELSIFKAIKTTTDMWIVKIAITGINEYNPLCIISFSSINFVPLCFGPTIVLIASRHS